MAVPFELGRPFGAPNAPEFQRRVLTETLQLLERNDGPVLEDFSDDPPGPPATMEGWACPLHQASQQKDLTDSARIVEAVAQEIGLLRPWYEESKKTYGRSLADLTDWPLEDIVSFMVAYIDDQETDSPFNGEPVGRALKLGTDDLRHFYYQAALAKPGTVSDVQLGDWFFGETVAGQVFLKLRDALQEQEDKSLCLLGNVLLVPYHQMHR